MDDFPDEWDQWDTETKAEYLHLQYRQPELLQMVVDLADIDDSHIGNHATINKGGLVQLVLELKQ